MLRFERVSKGFWLRGDWHLVLNDVSMHLPKNRVIALLGRNGAGKSTLLKIAAGVMEPTSGRVLKNGVASWPIGFAGSFHRDLTGVQNLRFLARIHAIDSDALCDFVESFAELGAHFRAPLREYSSGMIARLAFGAAMAIRFDIYLIDEVTAVGDKGFREKSAALFADRMTHASALLVSHNESDIRRFCTAGLVLERGTLRYFDDIETALAAYEVSTRTAPS